MIIEVICIAWILGWAGTFYEIMKQEFIERKGGMVSIDIIMGAALTLAVIWPIALVSHVAAKTAKRELRTESAKDLEALKNNIQYLELQKHYKELEKELGLAENLKEEEEISNPKLPKRKSKV